MSTEDPKGKFVLNGQIIEVKIDDLTIKPSPGKYTLPDGKVIVVEKPTEVSSKEQ